MRKSTEIRKNEQLRKRRDRFMRSARVKHTNLEALREYRSVIEEHNRKADFAGKVVILFGVVTGTPVLLMLILQLIEHFWQ